MKLHIRFDDSNVEDQYLTLFINSKNAGQLCMTPEEANEFTDILRYGLIPTTDEFHISGTPYASE
jgi:hypothetical protein